MLFGPRNRNSSGGYIIWVRVHYYGKCIITWEGLAACLQFRSKSRAQFRRGIFLHYSFFPAVTFLTSGFACPAKPTRKCPIAMFVSHHFFMILLFMAVCYYIVMYHILYCFLYCSTLFHYIILYIISFTYFCVYLFQEPRTPESMRQAWPTPHHFFEPRSTYEYV